MGFSLPLSTGDIPRVHVDCETNPGVALTGVLGLLFEAACKGQQSLRQTNVLHALSRGCRVGIVPAKYSPSNATDGKMGIKRTSQQ